MKLAVFKDYGVGRYFAQLFDGIPDVIFFLSDKNKSGMEVTPHKLYVLTKSARVARFIRHPFRAWRRFLENGFDRKKDFYYDEIESASHKGCFDIALTGSERSLYTLASLKSKGHSFKLVYWVPFTIPFVDVFEERSWAIRDFSFKYIDMFVAITDTCKKTLIFEGVPASKVQHVYPGIDLGVFRPVSVGRQRSDDIFRLLFVGKLVSWKGVFTLLYAVKALVEKGFNIELQFVGQGSQRARLEKVAGLMGVSSAIRFIGFVSYDELPKLYTESDIFVLPSLPAINLAEQFGFVVAEAMASGLPTIVSRVGGLPEVVGGQDDLIFTPGDYVELAGKVERLITNQALRATLGEFCLRRASENFDAHANGEKLRLLLNDLLVGKRGYE